MIEVYIKDRQRVAKLNVFSQMAMEKTNRTDSETIFDLYSMNTVYRLATRNNSIIGSGSSCVEKYEQRIEIAGEKKR